MPTYLLPGRFGRGRPCGVPVSDSTRRAAGRNANWSNPVNGTEPSTKVEGSDVAGLVAEASASRSGEDSRRRGWFWHWNSVVTQYAPLIGLKGVGLLNSYTVWTDRREESPHRGYAFPSQQSEADFYGEDRADLITINKILVALDLIEIRKEMVLKADEKGRRWRVPHNFYRVKDHDDGFTLSTKDVLKVVELADRDASVYRYVRRIFSRKFAPIGPDNVWHRLILELRQHPTWERLAARTAAEEDRASARTRAGHANRRGASPGPQTEQNTIDGAATVTATNDSTGVVMGGSESTIVAISNSGLEVDVAGSNRGSATKSMTAVERTNDGLPSIDGSSNKGRQTAVEPGNTMYDVSFSTTTTTTNTDEPEKFEQAETGTDRHSTDAVQSINRDTPLTVTQPAVTPAAGPGTMPPADGPNESAATRAFQDANDRPATPAERRLLRELAARFDPAATAQGASGWSWVASSIYEAVAAGSSFVAPRRIGEILTRWERDSVPASAGIAATPAANTTAPSGGDTDVSPRRPSGLSAKTGGVQKVERGGASQANAAGDPVDLLGDGPDIALPHGYGARRTWRFVVGLLGSALDRATLVDLVQGTAIVGYRDGEVTIAAADVAQAERLATTYRDLIARKLGEALRRPVRLAVLAPDPGATAAGDASGRFEAEGGGEGERLGAPVTMSSRAKVTAAGADQETPAIPVFPVPECGLNSDQVWVTVIAEVVARGDVSRANVDTWLRATALIGRGADGGLIVGASSAMAQRRIAGRFLPPLRAAAAAVLGNRVSVEVVIAREWLRANPAEAAGPIRLSAEAEGA